MTPDEEEVVELGLIANDATEVANALRAISGHEDVAVLMFACFPAAVFVAEEVHSYFSKRRRTSRFGSLDGALFDRFGHAVRKVRARIKLLDDNDTGPAHLASFMEFARQRSRVLFAHPRSRFIQAISAPFRPDLGAFFIGEHLVATSHAILPTLGFTPELLTSAGPADFEKLMEYGHTFAAHLGDFILRTMEVLAALGEPPRPLSQQRSVAPIGTSNIDFVSGKFYRRVDRCLGTAEPAKRPSLTVCLAQSNQVGILLPQVLGQDSNLLHRIQFLTAHHGSECLRAALSSALPTWLEPTANPLLSSRPLRNLMAHYGLREAAQFAIGSQSPFHAAVEGLAGVPAAQVFQSAATRVAELAEFLGRDLTRTKLWPYRAILGTHSIVPPNSQLNLTGAAPAS